MSQQESIERRGPRTARPVHPGEILSQEFLQPAGITQAELSRHIGCDIKTINRIVNGHTGVSPAMARKLGAALGPSAEFWLNLQQKVDLWEARQEDEELPEPKSRR
jgi:addiction module HigA family antidote